MGLPTNADRVVVRGFWWDETTQAGVGGTITFDPVPLTGTTTPNVRDATSYGHIKTRQRIARPDATTGYYAAMLLSSNDPDLDAYGGRKVTFSGETPFIIEVPYNAPTITVDAPLAAALPELHVGDHVKAVWLVDAALVSNPPPTPLNAYLTSEQTIGTIAEGIQTHNTASDAHADIRAAITAAAFSDERAQDAAAALLAGQTGKVSATYDDAGNHVALDVTGLTKADVGLNNVNNTADANKPVSTSQQAAIDAAVAGVPEQARDALGAALVAGSNVTITPNDGADTITISATVPSSYSDEQAQDAFAALIAAGTHSGISFAYNDAGNAISATVAAQTWSQITGKPTFAAVATSGSASDITTGTLPDGVIPAGIARDTEVATAVANLVNSAPSTLDTLGEIATALQADESAAATLTATVGGKATAFTQSATKTANYTAADNEIVPLDTSGGTFTLTGPASGKPFGFRWKAGTTAPTITAPSGYTISGAASVTPGLAPSTSSGELVLWQAFGTDYQPLGGFKPQNALNAANDARYDAAGAAAAKTALSVDGSFVSTYSLSSTPLTKADVGLGNVDNTSDINKPISTATQTAINALPPAAPPLPSGVFFFPNSSGGVTVSGSQGNGSLRLSPWVVTRSVSLSALGVGINSAGDTGCKYRLAIYNDNGNAYPGTLLLDAGQVAADAIGSPTATITLTLSAGLYWIGGAIQLVTTTQPGIACNASWNPPVPIQLGTTAPTPTSTSLGFAASGVTGACPGTYPAGQGLSGTVPRLFAKTA